MRRRSPTRSPWRRPRKVRRLSARPPEDAAPREEALDQALAALGRKERTTAELATLLSERGFARGEVEEVVSRLTEIGELDDERFAQRFAEDKRELNGWGPERIGEALASRGVAPELVDAVRAADSGEIQVRRAAELLDRRGEALDTDSGRARALGYLTRRGYDYEIAYEAIRAARRAA